MRNLSLWWLKHGKSTSKQSNHGIFTSVVQKGPGRPSHLKKTPYTQVIPAKSAMDISSVEFHDLPMIFMVIFHGVKIHEKSRQPSG